MYCVELNAKRHGTNMKKIGQNLAHDIGYVFGLCVGPIFVQSCLICFFFCSYAKLAIGTKKHVQIWINQKSRTQLAKHRTKHMNTLGIVWALFFHVVVFPIWMLLISYVSYFFCTPSGSLSL